VVINYGYELLLKFIVIYIYYYFTENYLL